MYIEGAARPRETAISDGGNDLSEGLMLLRASTLKIIRLQLAIERHDRQVALAAVDDLVALDRQLQDYLEGAPSSGEQLLFQRQLDRERAALNEEKLTLAAQIVRRPANVIDRPAPIEQFDPVEPARTEPLEPVREADEWLAPSDFDLQWEEPRRRRRWWLAIIPIILLSLGAAAYFFLDVPAAEAWLEQAVKALQ